ncbi:MAG: c-type cytochrome [Hyphomicrobiales bacterium]|nr:c-type cytochrome [Hyphomicrobiales bacterium]
MTGFWRGAAAGLVLAGLPISAFAGDVARGKDVFARTCQNCHATEIGVHKIGPTLWNIVGRQPASAPDYAYSAAMKANKEPWTPAALESYLANPREDLHGVKMYFKGLPDARDRADVITYLETLK